jgi:hypothetical protein
VPDYTQVDAELDEFFAVPAPALEEAPAPTEQGSADASSMDAELDSFFSGGGQSSVSAIDESQTAEPAGVSAAEFFAGQAAAPEEDSGYLPEIGSGLARGVGVRIPEMIGKTMQFLDQPGGPDFVRDAGVEIEEWAENTLESNPWLQESGQARAAAEESPYALRSGVSQASEMLGPSMGLPLAGAAIGSVVPGVGTAIGGLVGFAASLPMYFGSQAEESYRTVLPELEEKYGNTPEGKERAHNEAYMTGVKTGSIEAGGELVADLVTFRLFRLLPRSIKTGLVKSATKALRSPKDMIKDATKVMAAETGTEVGQAFSQEYVETDVLGKEMTGDSAMRVVVPTMLMSLATFGLADAVGSLRRNSLRKTLENGEAPFGQRAAAVREVKKELAKQDPELAQMWRRAAMSQLRRGEPVVAKEDAAYQEEAEAGSQAEAEATQPQASRTSGSLADEMSAAYEAEQLQAGEMDRLSNEEQIQPGTVPVEAMPEAVVTPEATEEEITRERIRQENISRGEAYDPLQTEYDDRAKQDIQRLRQQNAVAAGRSEDQAAEAQAPEVEALEGPMQAAAVRAEQEIAARTAVEEAAKEPAIDQPVQAIKKAGKENPPKKPTVAALKPVKGPPVEVSSAPSQETKVKPSPEAGVLEQTKTQWVNSQLKEQGIKKASPGFEAAKQRLADDFEVETDKALAELPFKEFNAHPLNEDSTEAMNRQSYDGLREEYGITGSKPAKKAAPADEELPSLLKEQAGFPDEPTQETGEVPAPLKQQSNGHKVGKEVIADIKQAVEEADKPTKYSKTAKSPKAKIYAKPETAPAKITRKDRAKVSKMEFYIKGDGGVSAKLPGKQIDPYAQELVSRIDKLNKVIKCMGG